MAQVAEQKEAGAKGRGRGRGRGRGKNSSSIPAVPEMTDRAKEPAPEVAPESPDPKHPPKRPVANTPERRQLFVEGNEEKENLQSSPPVKQPKKRARAKAKAAAAQAKAVAQSQSPPAQAELITGEGKAEEAPAKPERGPGKAAVQKAIDHLNEARHDDAEWHHVLKLFQSMDGKCECEKDVPKYGHWSLSMYWTTKRVGLLHKNGKATTHVASFGGGCCKNICLPLLAAQMLVWLLLADGTDVLASTQSVLVYR